MKRISLICFLCYLLLHLCSSFSALAENEQGTYSFDQDNQSMVVSHYYSLHSNYDNESLTIISQLPNNNWAHQKASDEYIEIKKGKNWFKLEVENQSSTIENYFLSLTQSVHIAALDSYLSINQLPINSNQNFLYNDLKGTKFSLPAYQKATLYLYIHSDLALKTSLFLQSEQAFNKKNNQRQFIYGIAIGGLICITIATLLWFFSLTSNIAILLFGYFASRTIFLHSLLGNSLTAYLPQFPELRGIEYPLLISIATIFFLLFTIELFQLKKNNKRLTRILWAIVVALIIYLPTSLLFSVTTNLLMSYIGHTLVALLLTAVGIHLYLKQQKLALLYSCILIIQLLFSITCFIIIFNQMIEQLPLLYIASSWINAFLIVFLFSRLYYNDIREKQVAQKQALEHAIDSQKTQKELLSLQEEHQSELEVRVQERTLELNIALQELEEANKELAEINVRDELSGLYNRRFYEQKLQAEFRRSKRNLTPLSLIIIDIDYFKKINDQYGHLIGDQCIKALARHLTKTLKRISDLACRYGGEEFCLILPETDQQGAIAIAEEIRANTPVITEQSETIPIHISCGVSTYLQEALATPKELFSAADKALYQAKQQGRNQVQFQPLSPME